MADFQLGLYILTQVNTIHYRHHYIGHDQVYIFIIDYRNGFLSIFGREYVIITLEQPHHQLKQFLIVFDYQKSMLLDFSVCWLPTDTMIGSAS